MTNIMTELEFRNQTELSEETLSSWIQRNILRPIMAGTGGRFFLPKHVRLVQGVRELELQNVEEDVIFQHVENEVLNVEAVLGLVNVNHRSLEYYQGLSYDELINLAREERITGFRRMTREELEICLSSPEQRPEIITAVRERNRRTPAPVVEAVVETAETPEVTEGTDYNSMSYKDLVIIARENAIPNFRRMTKEELIVCISGTSEEIDAVIIEVRERTRERYGSGSQNLEVDQMDLGEFFEELDGVIEDPDFFEEPFVAPVNNTSDEITVSASVEEDTPVTFVEETVQATAQTPAEEFAALTDLEPRVFELSEGDWVTEEVPFNLQQLQAMNSKQLAVVLRDHCPVKYFRRMTKGELLICIFQPERRAEMSENALLRYERYRGIRYGQNA